MNSWIGESVIGQTSEVLKTWEVYLFSLLIHPLLLRRNGEVSIEVIHEIAWLKV